MRHFLTLSFDGSSFSGWQIQKNGPSIQESLERAISLLLREEIKVTGAGRTDAGVHALNFVAHLDIEDPTPLSQKQLFLHKLNAILPPAVVINDIFRVKEGGHARFDAYRRCYQYQLHRVKTPFCQNYSLYFPYSLDIEKMNRGAQYLLGENDFTSMSKANSETKNNICTIDEALWREGSLFATPSSHSYLFTISGNRFLHNMVRRVVGSLLEVGRGKREPEWILSVIEGKERALAGATAPSHALFLKEVLYPKEVFEY